MKLYVFFVFAIVGLCCGKVPHSKDASDDDDGYGDRVLPHQDSRGYGGYYGQKYPTGYIGGIGRLSPAILSSIRVPVGGIPASPVPEYYPKYRKGYSRYYYLGSDDDDDYGDDNDDDGNVGYSPSGYGRISLPSSPLTGYHGSISKYGGGYRLPGSRTYYGTNRGSSAISQASRGNIGMGRGKRGIVSYGYRKGYYPGLGNREYYPKLGHFAHYPKVDDDGDDIIMTRRVTDSIRKRGYQGYYPVADDGKGHGDDDHDDDDSPYGQRSQRGYNYYNSYRQGYSPIRKYYGYRSSVSDDDDDDDDNVYPTSRPGYYSGRGYYTKRGYYLRPSALPSPHSILKSHYSRRGRRMAGNTRGFNSRIAYGYYPRGRGINMRIGRGFYPISRVIGKSSDDKASDDQVEKLVGEVVSTVVDG